MMKRWTWRVAIVLTACLGAISPARASVFGEENVLLAKMVAAHLQEIAHLTTLINNTRETVSAVNESLALARAVRRSREMLVSYNLADLERDARAGLFSQFPELQQLDTARRETLDANVDSAAQDLFRHSYRATIWPMVFPESLKFHPVASPAEVLVQQHFLRHGDGQRRAVQQTGLTILAGKVKAFVADSEEKDDVHIRSAATQTEIAFQTMQNTLELRDLKHIEIANEEARRQQDAKVGPQLGKAMAAQAGSLVTIRGRVP